MAAVAPHKRQFNFGDFAPARVSVEGVTSTYQNALVWKEFIIIGDVEATAETQATEVVISWYEVPSATSYTPLT
jgi:hypothetical protein